MRDRWFLEVATPLIAVVLTVVIVLRGLGYDSGEIAARALGAAGVVALTLAISRLVARHVPHTAAGKQVEQSALVRVACGAILLAACAIAGFITSDREAVMLGIGGTVVCSAVALLYYSRVRQRLSAER
jgi:hypothetical protein